MTDSKSRCVVEISTDTRPIVYLTIDLLSTDYRPTIDQLSTDHRPTIDRPSTDYRPTIDRISTDCRPTIDRLSTAISTAMSTDISVDITHSKQDPGPFQRRLILIRKLSVLILKELPFLIPRAPLQYLTTSVLESSPLERSSSVFKLTSSVPDSKGKTPTNWINKLY